MRVKHHSRGGDGTLPTDHLVAGRYRVLRGLKKGATSFVYEAEDLKRTFERKPNRRVALKVLSFQSAPSQGAADRVKREVDSARQLSHPAIAELLDVVADGEHLILVFELIRGPDLLEYLEQCGGRIPEALAQFCFQQLVSAVGHMHKLNFCHRDLKLENLMLDLHQQCLKVIDLGLASPVHCALSRGIGTPDYMCPEMILGAHVNDPKAMDIWGLGICLYAMVAGHMPFKRSERNKENINVLCRNILNMKLQPLQEDVSPECRALISAILQYDPAKRPTIHQLRQHPWLQPPSPGQELLRACITSQAHAFGSQPLPEGHSPRHAHSRRHHHRHGRRQQRHQSRRASAAAGAAALAADLAPGEEPALGEVCSDPDESCVPLAGCGHAPARPLGQLRSLPVVDSLTSIEGLSIGQEDNKGPGGKATSDSEESPKAAGPVSSFAEELRGQGVASPGRGSKSRHRHCRVHRLLSWASGGLQQPSRHAQAGESFV